MSAAAHHRASWRGPFFWIATGAFIGIVGTPLLVLGVEAAVALVIALGNVDVASSVGWALMLGVPLAFFAVLFTDASSRVRWALRWADRRALRITVLVTSAIVAAFFRVTMHIDFGAKASAAASSLYDAASTLAIAAPIAIGALLFGLRAGDRTTQDSNSMPASASSSDAAATPSSEVVTPILWLSVGCFASVVSFELGTFAWSAALWIGGRVGLGSHGIQCLVWIVTIATPPLCLAFAYGGWFARRRSVSPSPRAILRQRIFTIALVASGAAAIMGWLLVEPIHASARNLLTLGLYDDATEARTLASIVAGCMMPLAAGALMLRLRNEATVAASAASS